MGYDFFAYGESKPGPPILHYSVAITRTMEFLKNVWQLVRLNAAAGICHRHRQCRTASAHFDRDIACFCKFGSIVEQVDEYLLDFVWIGVDVWQGVRQIGKKIDIRFGGKSTRQSTDSLVRNFAGVSEGVVPGCFARFDSVDVQEIVDEPSQSFSLIFDDFEVCDDSLGLLFLLFIRGERIKVAAEVTPSQLGKAANGSQWRPQFMRNGRHQARLDLIKFGETHIRLLKGSGLLL